MGRREPITAKSGGVRPAWVDDEGLRPVAYVERKARLWNLLRRAGETIRYFDYVEGDGGAMLKAACSMELEGNDLRKIGGIKIVRANWLDLSIPPRDWQADQGRSRSLPRRGLAGLVYTIGKAAGPAPSSSCS